MFTNAQLQPAAAALASGNIAGAAAALAALGRVDAYAFVGGLYLLAAATSRVDTNRALLAVSVSGPRAPASARVTPLDAAWWLLEGLSA